MIDRRSALAAAAVVVLVLAGASSAHSAGVFRVDDSGTVVSQNQVPMRWRKPAPGRNADHTVEARLRVSLRLNLAPWINQPVRLYMGLAPAISGPVQASWRTQGRLLSGATRSGTRALVFDGTVATGVLEETLELALETDGRALVSSESLQFFFEVEPR